MDSLSHRLRRAAAEEEPRLRALSDSSTGACPSGAGRWSQKQELGHLVDSATNNRVRFIRTALEGLYSGPSYDGRGWVELGGYAGMPWAELVGLWAALNRALAAVVERIPPERLQAPCRIEGHDTVPLGSVIDDYILHMQHHLDRILSREHVTDYPRAAARV